MAKKPKPKLKLLADRWCGRHNLRTYLDAAGRRVFRCKTMPELSKYDGADDPTPCLAEFERRAMGAAGGDDTKGAA